MTQPLWKNIIILGLESQRQWQTRVLGVSVLKAPGYMARQVNYWLQRLGSNGKIRWSISDDYHCGGYARSNAELRGFLACASSQCAVPLEPVYSGKLGYALSRELGRGAIEPGTEVIAIHSGGLPLES